MTFTSTDEMRGLAGHTGRNPRTGEVDPRPARAGGRSALVSIIIPCRNEVSYITGCLESLLAAEIDPAHLEILVVDGMSDDGTLAVLAGFEREHAAVRVLENPKRTTPAALNIGLAHARGDVIMRVDTHAEYPPDYVPALVEWLDRSGADNVGGALITCPAREDSRARAIAAVMSHPFGVGNSHFRIGSREPREVDTVPFGCYRREVFERLGAFDEELVRNQDDEFNHRLLRAGGRILLVPHIRVRYYARESLAMLWRMYFQYGYFKPLVIRKLRGVLTLRQLVPAAFVLGLGAGALAAPWLPVALWITAAVVLAYAGATGVAAAGIARAEGPGAGLWACVAFPVLHFGYGIGFLRGMARFWVRPRRGKARPSAVPLSR